MGLLNYFKKKTRATAAKFFGFGAMESPSGWVSLTGANLRDQEKSGFTNAAVRAIVNAACNGELQLKNSDGSVVEYKKKGENPLYDLLYQPTAYFNENIFKQIIVCQMLFFGNVFILKDRRDGHGRPTQLIPVPQPCICPIFDLYGYPRAYKITTVEGSYTVPKEDIIHIYEGNALNLFMGESRMLRAKIDSDIMNAAKVFNLNFFRNGASLGGVIEYPNDSGITQKEADEALKMFNDRHQGEFKAHRWAALTHGGTLKDFKTSHKDMEYGEGLKFHQQQILSIAGVPPALVGLFEFAPQFNTKEQQKIFYETNIIPLMRLFADAFSEELVPDFYKNEDVYVWYDFSKVKALELDWNSLAQATQIFAQYFPINEVRTALGLPFKDVAGGDEPPNPVLSAFGLNAPKAETKSVKRTRLIRPTPAQLKRHKAEKLALIAQQSEVMKKSIESHFKMQGDFVKDWVSKNKDTSFNYNDCFGSQKEQEQLLLAVKVPAMAEIYQAGIDFEQAYLQSLAPSKDYRFTDKKAIQDRVQKWAEEHALLWAESIEETTLKRIDKIIELGTQQGMTNRQINNIVLQFFSEEGYEPTMLTSNATAAEGVTPAHISIFDRVGTIVQTETRSTIIESSVEAYKTTPFVNGKGWVTTMGISDHHEGHLEMDGQEVKVDGEFINPVTKQRTQAPTQFGTADQDINCLCDIYPVVIDED